jgi:hypothetical protein
MPVTRGAIESVPTARRMAERAKIFHLSDSLRNISMTLPVNALSCEIAYPHFIII